MNSDPIMDAKLRKAATRAKSQIRPTKVFSVRAFVKAHHQTLTELRGELGEWAHVAKLMEKQGVRWGNGSAISASQLRTLISLTKPTVKQLPCLEPQSTPKLPPTVLARPSRPRPSPENVGGLADLIDE